MFKKIITIIFLLIIIVGCGHRKSPTGGDKDVVNPVILAVTPDEYSDINGKIIEIEFSKPIERNTILSGLRIYPEIFKKKFRWSRNTLYINILEPLKKDTNYFLTLSTRIKGEHSNNLDKDYLYVFSSGELQEYTISGMISYEDDQDKNSPVKCRLSSADSSLIYTKELSNDSFVFENLNPGSHILMAYIDNNENSFYDYGNEPYFRLVADDQPIISIEMELAYEDTTKPFIKSVLSKFSNQIELTMSEKIASLDNVWIYTADSLMSQIPVIAFAKATSGDNPESRIDIVLNDLDTLKYYLVAENFSDYKGNQTTLDTLLIQGMPVADTIGPTIMKSSPRNGSSINNLQPEILIVFSEIVLKDDIELTLQGLEDEKYVDLEFVEYNSTSLIVKPESALNNLTSYRIELNANDPKGNNLDQTYNLDFIVIVR